MPGVGRVDFPGRSGTGFLTINGNGYTVLNSLGGQGDATGGAATLQGMAATANLTGYYALGSNIDASATSGWNGGAGFTPIGNRTTNFSGAFDGLGHTISGLTINDTAGSNDQGLFGNTYYSSIIRNVGLLGGSLTSSSGSNGSLVGMNRGMVSHAFATGTVSGAGYLGGLVGLNDSAGTISQSYATGAVSGDGTLGGLVGYHTGTISQSYATGAVSGGGGGGMIGGLAGFNYSEIKQSYATGSVSGSDGAWAVGGLVGTNYVSVSDSYATGAVTGEESTFVGGLVGDNEGWINRSYATGAVSGGDSALVGGLVGDNYAGTINQTYATGAVTGGKSASVGGLVGKNESRSKVIQSYATGAVSGGARAVLGGLIGKNSGSTITTSYWNTETSGRNTSAGTGAAGLTTAQMMTAASFAGWNPATAGGSNAVWRIYEGYTAPLLRTFMTSVAVSANDVTTTYTGAAYAGSSAYTVGALTPTFWLPSINVDSSLLAGNINTNTPAINAGGYLLNRGPYSGQMGYDIAFTAGNMTINPATLLFAADSVGRLYGAANPAFTGSVTGFVGADTLANATTGTTVFGSAAGAASNVGAYAVSGSGLTANNGNYVFAQAPANATALTINPATLLLTADSVSRPYGAANPAFTGSVTGFVGGDTLANATAGMLFWFSPADAHSLTGSYAINGIGQAANYVFAQASGNATALTVRAGDVPVPVPPAVATPWPAAWLVAALPPDDSKAPLGSGALTVPVAPQLFAIVGSGVRLP